MVDTRELLMRSYIRQLYILGAAGVIMSCAPTVQQEVQIGEQYSAEIERSIPMITDSRAVSAFNSSIAPLKSVVRRKDLNWEFRIVNSD